MALTAAPPTHGDIDDAGQHRSGQAHTVGDVNRLDVEVVLLVELAVGDVPQRRLAADQLRVTDTDRRRRRGGI
jgi:hypothetical protein